jgi:UDP-N-acetylmuramoyl-L-alanyl-D-glutamate--2,6-diaminopimelate ligase
MTWQRARTRLSDLGLTARAGRDPALSGLTADSRAVRPGMLFAALAGSRCMARQFIGAWRSSRARRRS